MSGPHSETEDTKQVSVAELLARNGTIGEPTPTRRRRRRRGDDSVTVAELTGEIPVIRDDARPPEVPARQHDIKAPQQPPAPPAPVAPSAPPNGGVQVAPVVSAPPQPVVARATERATEKAVEPAARTAYWSEPEPRWPKSDPFAKRSSGPERSEYPRPLRHTSVSDADGHSGAEGMSPDPVGHYTDASVDVMDSEVREAESSVEDSAYVRSYLQGSDGFDGSAEQTLFGGQSIADEVARRRSGQQTPAVFAEDPRPGEAAAPRTSGRKMAAVGRAIVTVLQSILAVAFGGGLFIAFDQLWRWNAIVALVLSVLVILGLVVGVRVVRKTEDIASTLIAVAVGALITLGPMALLQTG